MMTRDTGFLIETAAEGDWPWMVEGLTEIAWGRLSDEQRQGASQRSVRELVKQHVVRIRGDAGFPSQAFVGKTLDGQLAGFVWVAKVRNESTGQPEACLLNQYVDKVHRGQGLGHRLMETAEEWVRHQGLARVSVRVSVHNRLGQRLYETLGYKVDIVRMTKELDA